MPGSNLNPADYPTVDNQFWRQANAIWPDLLNQRALVIPARNGMDRFTGKMLHGWPHVEQSMSLIFATPFHERVLRRWVGSFVPIILGRSAVQRIITRFFWAIASAIDLWEPGYRIKQVYFMGDSLRGWRPDTEMLDAADMLRLGNAIFRQEGIYFPRGHLGNFTPFERKGSELIGRGHAMWDVVQINNN